MSKTQTSKKNTKWLIEIQPQKGLFDINLKALWRYRDLIWLFVKRDFTSKYKQTILGPIWFIIQPLLTTIMFFVVFHKIANIPTDGVPPTLFYLTGIIGWTYFSQCLTLTSHTFLSNANIFGKVYFPRLSVPISVVISNLVTFLIQLIFLIGFLIYFHIKGANITTSWSILFLPFLVLLMALMGLGFGIIISSMTTKYRDLSYLVGFGMQLWMYATPVAYPLSELSGTFRTVIQLNPLTPVMEMLRSIILGVSTIDSSHIFYSIACTVIVLFIGVLTFSKVERSFMDTV